MKKYIIKTSWILAFATILFSFTGMAHPIDDYYKAHKNDVDMEGKIVPPKVAARMVDKDYPEAIDLLKSLTTLKYLNFWGDKSKISGYVKNAISAKGNYKLLLEKTEKNRHVTVFGIKKKGYVRRLMAVVKTKSQFLLLIGKGKLTDSQIKGLPALSREIQ